jgi:hypothetical protein
MRIAPPFSRDLMRCRAPISLAEVIPPAACETFACRPSFLRLPPGTPPRHELATVSRLCRNGTGHTPLHPPRLNGRLQSAAPASSSQECPAMTQTPAADAISGCGLVSGSRASEEVLQRLRKAPNLAAASAHSARARLGAPTAPGRRPRSRGTTGPPSRSRGGSPGHAGSAFEPMPHHNWCLGTILRSPHAGCRPSGRAW